VKYLFSDLIILLAETEATPKSVLRLIDGHERPHSLPSEKVTFRFQLCSAAAIFADTFPHSCSFSCESQHGST
jgi:hypothetical protein